MTFQCDEYQTTVFGWSPDTGYEVAERDVAALYGYVVHGTATVSTETTTFRLSAGQYFSISPKCRVSGGTGLIVRHEDFEPLQQCGGPIENVGRLRYINGCTDTLLIPPARWGDPCLNALYFPSQTDQQPHTHPSIRVGVVASGNGTAVLPDRTEPLNSGDIFAIMPEGLHSFRTGPDQQMTVIAYHPDSDFGPRDEDHPMINRTIIDHQSASQTIRHNAGQVEA